VVRTQIQLTDAQAQALKRVARERDVSMAQLVREAVDRVLDEDERQVKWRRALAVVGKYRDREGRTDVARNHDRYLAEIYRA
jgi:hypothetical protein